MRARGLEDYKELLSSKEGSSFFEELVAPDLGDLVWVPNPGPQTEAYFSPADEVFYGGQAGGGKRLNIKEILPTPTGFVEMGEVKIGDEVFDINGAVCRVIAVSDIEEAKESYAVSFSDGTVVEADAEHLWLTLTNREREQLLRATEEWRDKRKESRPSRAAKVSEKPWVSESITRINRERHHEIKVPKGEIRTTREIMRTLRTGGKRDALNHAVPLARALALPEARLPIDPYLLGLWLGDGFSKGNNGIGMLAEDWAELHEYVADEVSSIREERIGHRCLKPFTIYNFMGFSVALKELGLYGNKHIPMLYLRASIEQRKELLRGLLDTDGHCAKNGQIELALSSKKLIDSVYELVCSLGLKTTVQTKRLSDRNPKHQDSHKIKFLADFPAFKLKRKLERQKLTGFRKTGKYRYITSVAPIPPVKMRCIGIDSPTHLYLVGRSMVPTHNTDLLLGLAFTQHKHSLILRRTNTEATGLGERASEILGTRDGFNSQTGMWRYKERVVELGGCQLEEDKQKRKGKPHDLIGFDEVSDFTQTQYEFIIGWNRSANPAQRCRVVAAGNPPTRPEGIWVLKRWAAWLDPTNYRGRPAEPGELRWYTTDPSSGEEIEVDGPGPHLIAGEYVHARSRTFIPATLNDNPDLRETNYQASLDSLPAELRAAYRDGNFSTVLADDPYQIIPTEWVTAAQSRWEPRPPVGIPMCAIGADIAIKKDFFVLAPRHDSWFAPLVKIKGQDTADPKQMAGNIMAVRRDGALVIVDAGGGWGTDCYGHLIANGIDAVSYMGVKATHKKDKDNKFKFSNVRTEALWRMREALDPSQPGGSQIALPPSSSLKADLCAPSYSVKGQGADAVIVAESKEKVKERLGRSTDEGDAVIMSWYKGLKQHNIAGGWADLDRNKRMPVVNRGRRYR